jgi:hypothetical protein
MTGRKLIQWLKAQGAKPLDPATRKRLAAAGHLGLPGEWPLIISACQLFSVSAFAWTAFSMSAFQLFSFCLDGFQHVSFSVFQPLPGRLSAFQHLVWRCQLFSFSAFILEWSRGP